jgi:outer membrane receptor protein involved in Fe transport
MTRRISLRLLAAASPLVLAVTAHAQTAPAADAAAAQDGQSTTDIVVTGSRVIRDGSASPTPLTTVGKDLLTAASPAGTISDSLNNLPVFSGSRNQFSNPGSNATGVQGGNGTANVLNLRNLGFYRTLVLFDGHRIPPTLFNSAVDVDLIPQELIQRVDVVTGGVSAVYGSDAVSGVVNYVLDRHFNGLRAHAEAGISERGDAGTRNVGLALGTNVGSRGHFELSVQHRENDGILNRVGGDRGWDNLAAIQGAGKDGNPYHLATNVHLNSYAFGGLITSGALAANGPQMFGSDGVLSPFVTGEPTGSSCCSIGGDGAYQNSSMVSPLKSTQVFGRFDYDVTDGLHFYVQGAANLKSNMAYTGWNSFQNLTFSADNAFLADEYSDALGAAGEDTFNMNEILKGAPRIQTKAHTKQFYVNAGVEGKLGSFDWDATYTHGASTLHTRVNNLPNNQRLAAALDAVTDPSTGDPVCEATLAGVSGYSDCVPLDLFGPTAASADALDYVLGSVDFRTHTIMDSADASIHGEPFSTWAGPVGVALSGEWRRLAFDASSSVLPTAYADCTGLRYNCTSTTTLYPTTFPYSGTVSQSVKEGAIEVEIPLLKDSAIARSFDLNAAARYTDYSTSGHYVTWKVGAVWQVTDDLKFRGTASRDIRAPTLYDLFQPQVIIPGLFTDTLIKTDANGNPVSGVSVYVPSINDGNPDLKAEVGRTYTAGVVYQPHFLPGATFTVDYYHTVISDAITVVQGFNAATQQACYDSDGSSPYCSLIARPGPITDTSFANAATAFYITPQNIAKVRTYGIDAEADYRTRLGGHSFGLRVLANYQPHIYYEQPGFPTTDQGGAGWGSNGLMPSPSLQLAGFLDYEIVDGVRLNIFEHYRNSFRRSGVKSQVFSDPKVPSFATTNLTMTFDTGSAWKIKSSQFYVSVTNLFDAKPPLSGYYSGTTSAGQSYEFSDDPTGRAFLVGFRITG